MKQYSPKISPRVKTSPMVKISPQVKTPFKEKISPKKTSPKVTHQQYKIKKCTVSVNQVRVPSAGAGGASLTCKDCGQEAEHRSNLKPLLGAIPEEEAVKMGEISVLSWEDSKSNSWPLSFKAVEVSVHDGHGHLVPFDSGLIESSVKVYLTAKLRSILDDSKSVEVGGAGPLRSWRKYRDKIILATSVDGMDVEYHIETSDFSQQYNEALSKLSIGQFTSIIEEAFVDLASSSDEEETPTVVQRKKASTTIRPLNGNSSLRKRPSTSPDQPRKRLSLDTSWPSQRVTQINDRRSLPAERGGGSGFGGEEGKLNKVLKSLGLRSGAGKPLDRCTSNSCFFSTLVFFLGCSLVRRATPMLPPPSSTSSTSASRLSSRSTKGSTPSLRTMSSAGSGSPTCIGSATGERRSSRDKYSPQCCQA